jgi:oxygen-independent coproporphyrinogen-3 oxidase
MRLHGVNFLEMFADEIAGLVEKGLVTVDGDGIEVTGPKGWYYLDNISKTFYSPEFRRYPQHLGADITGFISPQRALPLEIVNAGPQGGCHDH